MAYGWCALSAGRGMGGVGYGTAVYDIKHAFPLSLSAHKSPAGTLAGQTQHLSYQNAR